MQETISSQPVRGQIQYKSMEKADQAQVIPIVAGTFIKHEPVSQALGLQQSDMEALVKEILRHPGVARLSTVAYHEPTGVVVGAFLAEDFADPSPIPQGCKALAPVLALLDLLEKHYPASHPLPQNRHLHLYMLGVDEAFMLQGVAGLLTDFCLYHAAKFGFTHAFAEATASGSQHLLNKRGFETLFEIPYADFEFTGRKVFSQIQQPPSVKLMARDIPPRPDAFPS